MKYFISFLVFIILIMILLRFFYKPHYQVTADWLSLSVGIQAPIIPKGSRFESLKLNGRVIQKTLRCDTCPYVVTLDKETNTGLVYKLTVKKRLKSASIDTLKMVCQYENTWSHLRKPVCTFLIQTECEVISQLIYKKVIENLNVPTIKETTSDTLKRIAPLDLNIVFQELVQGTLKNWMELNKNQPLDTMNLYCYQYFNALKYIAEGSQHGFKPRKYNLQDSSLQDNSLPMYLQTIASTVTAIAQPSNVLKGELAIYVTGYADMTPLIGTAALQKEMASDNIACHRDCIENKQVSFPFILLNQKIQPPILDLVSIHNNCELSTVRAYHAVKFLHQLLGKQKGNLQLSYYYRSGGVTYNPNLAANRKVNVAIQFNAIH